MNKLKNLSRRSIFASLAALFGVTATLPALFFAGSAAAAGQVTTRSITMSTSTPGAAATYSLTFTPITTAQELIVDFCSNTPLIGDTCSFSAATVPTIAAPVSSAGTASAVGSGSPVHTIKVVGLTMTGGSPYTINFTAGITNPTAVTTTGFYARIITYATGNATGYAPATTTGGTTTVGTDVDYGGDALSTTSDISITAKVFETLTFCVFTGTCGTAPSLTLGDSTTGALSSTGAYVNSNAKYTLATNASHGVAVTMKGTTLCDLTGNANCLLATPTANTITPLTTTPAISALGTEQFGMCADIFGSSALTVGAAYVDSVNACHTSLTTGPYAGSSKFGFDNAGVNSAAGSTVLTSTGAVPSVTDQFAFLANIAATTEAGIYTTTLNMVATSTF